MSFYLVTDPDSGNDAWLAWEDTANAKIYAHVPNLGAFVRHNSLSKDFYWDMELRYRPIDVDEAVRIVDEGRVGKLDAHTYQQAILDHLAEVEDRKDPAELLGSSRFVPKISARRAAVARAARIRNSEPGEWVTWRSYPPEHKQRAYVAANNLRNGKIRALADVPIDVRLVTDAVSNLLVQVSRKGRRTAAAVRAGAGTVATLRSASANPRRAAAAKPAPRREAAAATITPR